MSTNDGMRPVFDPYDPWTSSFGVIIKKGYYQGSIFGKLSAIFLGTIDWIAPHAIRILLRSTPRLYPIVVAQTILRGSVEGTINRNDAQLLLETLKATAVDPSNNSNWAWGLGFSWMSKNGLYDPDVPFVTHTPYVMEALLQLAGHEKVKLEAMTTFNSTWDFLQSLIVMQSSPDKLALSYAPKDEPRIVVNANSYAAFAYALHAHYGLAEIRQESLDKTLLLVKWIVAWQNSDGSWPYYADKDPGNFIDCFHTCFVIKNLFRIRKLCPCIPLNIDDAITKGWNFLNAQFYVAEHGLCRRFLYRDIKDPYVWDLYDQAEYLGLLIDLGLIHEACRFSAGVESRFKKRGDWYCRIDIFGRLWGKGFSRWGITSMKYNLSRLRKLKINNDKSE